MDNIFKLNHVLGNRHNRGSEDVAFGSDKTTESGMHINGGDLTSARINQEYSIKTIETDNDEVQEFLFTLGCYKGEPITLISILSEQYVIVVKDARYSIDKELAKSIIIND